MSEKLSLLSRFSSQALRSWIGSLSFQSQTSSVSFASLQNCLGSCSVEWLSPTKRLCCFFRVFEVVKEVRWKREVEGLRPCLGVVTGKEGQFGHRLGPERNGFPLVKFMLVMVAGNPKGDEFWFGSPFWYGRKVDKFLSGAEFANVGAVLKGLVFGYFARFIRSWFGVTFLVVKMPDASLEKIFDFCKRMA